jgi:AcrR family transcriptional regulator
VQTPKYNKLNSVQFVSGFFERMVTGLGKTRQVEKKDEVRNRVLEAARNIISEEGIQGLSIRKITKTINYSPAIIYHYFKDKNEIIETIVNEGFGRILRSVSLVQRNEYEPEKEFKEIFLSYIKVALSIPEEYKAVMLNDDPMVLKKTRLLEKGISKKSPTMQALCDNLRRGIEHGRYAPCDPELTAQIIWTATFGLIIKLLIEKDITELQIQRLLEQHFNVLFHGIMLGKEGKT